MNLVHRPPSSLDDTILKALRLIDEETGIIKTLYEAPSAPDSADFFGCGALCADHAPVGYASENEVSGSTGLTRDRAIVGAIGEAVERYSAAYVPQEEIIFATPGAVGQDGVQPASLVLYEPDQFTDERKAYRAPAVDDEIGWVEGWSLTHEHSTLVPAFAVYQPYQSRYNEAPVVQQVTTGLACGGTREEAILSAICEVIERDASMLMWLQSRIMPVIAADCPLPAEVETALARFGEARKYVKIIDITSEIQVPAYVAAWDGPISGVDGGIFASCAKPTAKAAAVGAISELAQCLIWAASLIEAGEELPDPLTSDFERIEEHVLWPLRSDARSAWHFLVASDRQIEFPVTSEPTLDVLDSINLVVASVAKAGLETVIVDVTSPDIQDVGLHVVRAIVPGSQPLFFGAGMHRVSQRARELCYPDRAQSEINLHPHPFP